MQYTVSDRPHIGRQNMLNVLMGKSMFKYITSSHYDSEWPRHYALRGVCRNVLTVNSLNTYMYYLVFLQLIEWTDSDNIIHETQGHSMIKQCCVHNSCYIWDTFGFLWWYHSESKICHPFCELLKSSWGKPATCWSRLVTSVYISNNLGTFGYSQRM